MKYICQECGKLIDETEIFAKDGDGYFCSKDCYNASYNETVGERITNLNDDETDEMVTKFVEIKQSIDVAKQRIESVAKRMYGDEVILDENENIVIKTKRKISTTAIVSTEVIFAVMFLIILPIFFSFELSMDYLFIFGIISSVVSIVIGITWGISFPKTDIFHYLDIHESREKTTIISIDLEDNDDYDFYKNLSEESKKY